MIKKFLISNFKFLIFVFFVFLYPIPYTPYPAHALDSTQSATESADFKAKLKSLQDEIASKAAQLKNEVNQKLQNKAYVGFARFISSTSLNIETNEATKSATVNEFTQFTSAGRVIKNAAIGDYIAALGDVDETGVLTAKKIIKFSPPATETKIIYGKVISKADKQIIIQDKKGQNLSLKISNKTFFKTGQEDTAIKEIAIGKPIIAIGTSSKTDIIQTRFIYIIPTKH